MQISPEKVKFFRKEKAWSQEVLAKAAGLSLRTVQRVEKEGNASTETLLSLAAALNKTQQELLHISDQIETLWKWRSIMQNLIALLMIGGAIGLLVFLAGAVAMYIDAASILFVLLFMYACTAIAFGPGGLIRSITGLRHLFSQTLSASPATEQLKLIFKKQIYFLYGSALIGILIGCVAIHANIEGVSDVELHRGYAVNILVLFYAAIVAEGILRPLATKLAVADKNAIASD